MPPIGRIVSALVASTIGIAVMVVLATIVYYIAIFIVGTGARLAGYTPSGDFVILSAALLVVAVILTGGLTPRLSAEREPSPALPEDIDDATYD